MNLPMKTISLSEWLENKPAFVRIEINCDLCGAKFTRPAFDMNKWVKRGHSRLFCGRKCSDLAQREKNVMRICEICGVEFRLKEYTNPGKYCSRACKDKAHQKIMTGDRNPKWRDGTYSIISDPAKGQRLLNHLRSVRMRSVKNTLTKSEWRYLLKKSKHCHWCKRPWSRAVQPTIDHIIPVVKGGGNVLENVTAACKRCNSKKGARTINPITGQGILL